jgi:hypothetical protein
MAASRGTSIRLRSTWRDEMVIVSFPDGADWYKANWAFRQLADDISARFPEDEEICNALEQAQAFGHLDLAGIDGELRGRLMQAMRNIIVETIDGRIEGWKASDDIAHRMYRESLVELLAMIEQQHLS